MAYLVVRHKVKDYDTWQEGFDLDEPNRWASGSRGGLVLRNADDQQELVVILEWDSAKALREFASSRELKERMRSSGVIDEPDIHVLDLDERPRA